VTTRLYVPEDPKFKFSWKNPSQILSTFLGYD
jgi:hypothetical protein